MSCLLEVGGGELKIGDRYRQLPATNYQEWACIFIFQIAKLLSRHDA
jgi:hypothetical protein